MTRKEFHEAEQALIDAAAYARSATYGLRSGSSGGNRVSQAITRDDLGTMRVNAINLGNRLAGLIDAIEQRDPSLRD